MKRILALVLLGIALLWPTSAGASYPGGQWVYSAYPQYGYAYYYAQWYGGAYWYAGYYKYIPPVVITQYYPVNNYIPIAFSTYQPGAVTAGTTLTLTAATPVAQLQVQPQVPVLSGVGVQAQPLQGQADPCKAMLALMERRLAALEATKASTPSRDQPPPAGARTILKVLNDNCAKCHEAATAKEKGGEFVLLQNGQVAGLTDKQVVAVYRNVLAGKMPPPKDGKLSEEDGQALLGWLDTLKTGK